MPTHDQIMGMSGIYGGGVRMSDFSDCRHCGVRIYRDESGWWRHFDDVIECWDPPIAAPILA